MSCLSSNEGERERDREKKMKKRKKTKETKKNCIHEKINSTIDYINRGAQKNGIGKKER